jgi:hypothetical protein
MMGDQEFQDISSILSEKEVSLLADGEYENISLPLTDWHRSLLENITNIGIQCLVYMWFTVQPKLDPGNVAIIIVFVFTSFLKE